MIKAVLFDYGGVLTTAGRKDSLGKVVAELFGVDIGWDNLDDLHDKLRRGLISAEDFFKQLSLKHKSSKLFSEKEWHEASQQVFERSEPVYNLARKLKNHNIKTGILSNIYKITADVLRNIGNYEDFDPVILSCDVKMAKPDVEIYQLAIRKLGVKPQEIIFVDDQEKCWLPAEKLGMKVVKAQNPQQIIEDVDSILRQENGIKL